MKKSCLEMHRKATLRLLAATSALLFSVCAANVTASPNELPDALQDADFYENGSPDPVKVELGKNLFFDKILSGNQNISCATCHHSLTDTGDGLSLPVGEGGAGLGVTRDTGTGADAIHERVPRNAPPVFNLGAREMQVLFHDGRVEVDGSQPSGFRSPAGNDLPLILDNVLAAQAMFPVTSGTEMAGQLGENAIADAAAAGDLPLVWELIAQRLRAIPGYVDLFLEVYPELGSADEITYAHAANAIAAFEAFAWRADNSPFDRYLRGQGSAMTPAQKRGMRLFYGKANCASCHSGAFQTDLQFHAIAMPQVGPGKGDNLDGYNDGHDDLGRERVTGDAADRLKFRTPPLRNVALTAPYGHAGAYDTLEAVIRHHLDPVAGITYYDPSQLTLPERDDLNLIDLVVMEDPARVAMIADHNELEPADLQEKDIADLVEFMHALTDPGSIDLRKDTPVRVPSGLTLAE